MKSIKDLLGNIAISAAAIVLSIMVLETITRIVLACHNRKSFAEILHTLPPVKNGANVTLGQMIQPSPYPRIIYELRPNINVNFFGTVRINGQGWRADRDFTMTKKTNTVRIVGLGDSYMFGQGCNQNENALSFLREMLNSRFPQKQWEVINTAVPGYNTVMEVETLKRKLLGYMPDIVIIEYVANDMDLPNFIYDTFNFWDMSRLYSFEIAARRLRLSARNFELYDAPHSTRYRFEFRPQRVPLQYKNIVGWNAFVGAMRELRAIQEQNNFLVICLITWRDEDVFELSKQLGFFTLNNSAYDPRDKSIVLKDLHPSVLGHQKTAAVVFDFMMRNGLIDRFLEKE